MVLTIDCVHVGTDRENVQADDHKVVGGDEDVCDDAIVMSMSRMIERRMSLMLIVCMMLNMMIDSCRDGL